MTDEKVWIIDDDQSIRWVLDKAFQKSDMEVRSFASADEVIHTLQYNPELPDVIVSDVRMPGTDGLNFLRQFREDHPDLPIIIMTAHSDLGSAVSAYESGAFEYIPKPFDVDEVIELTHRACTTAREAKREAHAATRSAGANEPASQELIGTAPAMQEVFRAIGRLSRSNIAVLINGESGSGKELIAKALHRHSPRAKNTFIALNMAAIPHELMESELFGHEKGAFTGAQTSRIGRFEQADGGTLFLDEIGDMPAPLQTRLLRVLADGQFYRVGGHTPIKVDVRIIAATHQNLEELVKQERFREDLFHRLNVIRVRAPSLRERREDIPLLLRHFLASSARELEVEAKTMSKEFENYVTMLDWPGNVRQLENTARWLTVMASGKELKVDDLPRELLDTSAPKNEAWEAELRQWANKRLLNGDTNLLDTATPAFERIMISCAMERTQNKRQEAARLLGWGRNTLTRKIKELGLEDAF
ncbi:nitrogen regulation protein NR(I) [Granulosicoccaceae sp. 1_MG-2023]|nr:nitrogen regulation protein NR(I) [Granulosicoccaceae sp. 1_MG-2023]